MDQQCQAFGIADWRDRFCRIHSGYFKQSLRNLLAALGIQNWCEITSGFSWREYAALDAYVRIFSGGMLPPEEEAWYLLNVDVPSRDRIHPVPEDWWRYTSWLSIGQRACIDEWELFHSDRPVGFSGLFVA